jgi:hypothetical protein
MKKFYSSLAMLAVLPALASCGDDLPNPLGGACDLSCKGVVEANGSVSGIASVDAFFTSALKFKGQAGILEADIRGILAEMALSLGINAGGSVEQLAGRIESHIKGGFEGKIEGGIDIKFAPPRCEVNAQASLQAAARCDASVDPGKASVECHGGCVVEASAAASCEGELKCTGKAPAFECKGSCEGTCNLSAGGKCEGTCSGSCNFETAGKCDGECKGSTDEGGNCTGECEVRAGGSCNGTCTGSCELNVAAECSGECKGSCTFDAPEASCDGELTCEAEANAMVECKGECKGEVVPPKVKAECEASVKAEADFSAECSPPSLDVDYTLSAELQGEGNVDARLAFEAQLQGFVKAFGKLQAKAAKLELVAKAGADLLGAADGAVKGAVNAAAKGDVGAALGAQCALGALGETQKLIGDASKSVSASVNAVGKIGGAIGG